MAYICAKCGSSHIVRFYAGTPREEWHCRECRAVDQVEGQEDEPQEKKDQKDAR